MLRRIRNSLAYRSSRAYRFMLRRWRPSRPVAAPGCDTTYLTFSGRAQLDLLRESVLSIAHCWSRLPRLRIVSDGTAEGDEVRRLLAFWPGTVDVLEWRDLARRLTRPEHERVIAFAERVPMARKLVAVAGTALEAPTLYADTDVLWFRKPHGIADARSPSPRLLMSSDMGPSYDGRVVPSLLPDLEKPPYYCAGLLFAEGDFLAACDLSRLLDFAAIQGVERTEQTIFAEANRQLGGECWPLEEVYMSDDDRFSLRPSFIGKPWAARHYIGQVRHIFWRDAFALRIKAMRRAPWLAA